MNRDKYEILPGLRVGSEISDLNKDITKEIYNCLNGDESAYARIDKLSLEREKRILTNFSYK